MRPETRDDQGAPLFPTTHGWSIAPYLAAPRSVEHGAQLGSYAASARCSFNNEADGVLGKDKGRESRYILASSVDADAGIGPSDLLDSSSQTRYTSTNILGVTGCEKPKDS